MKTPFDPMPGASRAGACAAARPLEVCWLDCGARSLDGALSELGGLAAGLGGAVAVIERAPGYVVVKAQMSPTAAPQLKGALALAGASFPPPDADAPGDGVLIFILSSEGAS